MPTGEAITRPKRELSGQEPTSYCALLLRRHQVADHLSFPVAQDIAPLFLQNSLVLCERAIMAVFHHPKPIKPITYLSIGNRGQ